MTKKQLSERLSDIYAQYSADKENNPILYPLVKKRSSSTMRNSHFSPIL